jgi:hypothetical protein
MSAEELLITKTTNEILELYKSGLLAHLKDIKLTSTHIREISGSVLLELIRKGILHTEQIS